MKHKKTSKISNLELREYTLSLKASIEKAVTNLGFSLIDLVLVYEYNNYYLRVTVDHQLHPVTLDDCKLISNQVEKTLDVKDPIPFPYHLEVQSKGISNIKKENVEHEFILDKVGLTVRT